jgi:hypothetical protein
MMNHQSANALKGGRVTLLQAQQASDEQDLGPGFRRQA